MVSDRFIIIFLIISITALIYPSETQSGWFFKSDKEKILGIWETNYDYVDTSKIPKNKLSTAEEMVKALSERAMKKIRLDEKIVVLTFHEHGQITHDGFIYGWYKFTGDHTIEYKRKGRATSYGFLIPYYFTLKFSSFNNEMVWYQDNKKWRSFRRLKD